MGKEIWKDIDGFEGLYEISSIGQINSIKRNGTLGGLLKQRIDRYGYSTVVLYKNGTPNYYSRHRLVAQAFIPNPNNYPEVNHKNGKKLDNFASNLEWVTAAENTRHAWQNGLVPHLHGMAHYNYGKKLSKEHKRKISNALSGLILNKRPVICINTSARYASATDAGERLKIDNSQIGKCCKGKVKTAGGYQWKYAE